jgi:hypothetical protein
MRKPSLFLAPAANPISLTFNEKLLLDSFRAMDPRFIDSVVIMLCNLAEQHPAHKEPKPQLVAATPARSRRGK